MSGTLYLVPTPIGNLGDISRRMAETIKIATFKWFVYTYFVIALRSYCHFTSCSSIQHLP